MAKKSPIPSVRQAARKVAAPFWKQVEASGLDRFFLDRLLRALLRRWKDDRFARVRQGGLHSATRVELSQVFIDLEVTSGDMRDLRRLKKSERVVASWMQLPRTSTVRRGQLVDIGFGGPSVPLEVVLGGPGQGKSTVGRFLVLIHASILLLTAPIEAIVQPADVQHLEAFLACLPVEEIPLPSVLCLPVWIELRELTDALLRDDENERDALGALLRWYAKTELREAGDVPAVETALTSLPWVMVFDGLDEVPPERGRTLVRACVTEVRGRFASAQGYIIGTSRPQSYDREVFGENLVERTLLPLKPERAAIYTERFAAHLYFEEEGERARLLKHMRDALANPATAALMQNPLLVTIMASIVIHHGTPSGRRWTLFEEYYRTLYDRETERGTFASSTLRVHADLIHAIHMHVGMSLQARTEDAAGVSALMPEYELRAIIRKHLLRNHPSDEAVRLTGEILRAAEQRLVLLVQAQEGMYGFELRSFQEFMAGWQLVSLREAPIDALLLRLAPLNAWRNVVLFAIGQQYATGSALTWERSIGLCAALNRSDEPGMKLALRGSALALAVLEDAPYGTAPKPRDALNVIASELSSISVDGMREQFTDQVLDNGPEQMLFELDNAVPEPVSRWAYGGATVDCEFHVANRGQNFTWALGSIHPRSSTKSERLRTTANSSASTIQDTLTRFDEKGSAGRLAEALEELAGAWIGNSGWEWSQDVPWPLLACVMAAQNDNDLRTIAKRLRRGELGDGERWTEIERQFGEVGDDRLKELAASPDPLRAILVEGAMPPFDWRRGSFPRAWSGTPNERNTLRDLDAIGQAAAAPWVQKMVSQIILNLVALFQIKTEPLAAKSWPSAGEFIRIIETADVGLNIAWLLVLFPTLHPSDFANIFSQTTARIEVSTLWNRITSLHDALACLLDALSRAPDSQRLQRATVVVLHFETQRGETHKVVVEPSGDGVDAWILRFISGHASNKDVPTIARLLASTQSSLELLESLELLAAYDHSRHLVIAVVEALVALPDLSIPLRSTANVFVVNHLGRARIDLTSHENWAAAGLPLPSPMIDLPNLPELPGARIASVEIDNLRAFAQPFEVKAPESAGPGQWMVFLGENATGKTTLLRGIAMALASASDASAVPSNLEGPLRRDASREGFVRVLTTDGRDLKTTVTGPAGDERVAIVETTPILRPWVVAYGCRRGSAISGTDMDNAFVPFRDLDNLFDRPRGVVRVSGWLKELQRLAISNGSRSKMVFEAARAALRKMLLGAENIIVENDVHVEFANRRIVQLTLLSDGYLTTAGWVVDLMARWLKRNEGRKDIDENFCTAMEGVVLLDEIDLHLHPKWQERVIEDVRTLFPKMTFVATTHHPLTLRGARKGEVFVLGDHDSTGNVTALQRDIPPGTRVDELLTGEWFNRPSAIVDTETRAKLDEHQRMIVGGAKAGDPKRKALEAELRERLGRYADTSLERLAATIVAKYLDEGPTEEPSAQKREEVQARVLKILKRRDAKRG